MSSIGNEQELESLDHRVHARIVLATMTVYSTITLLGVLEAACWKGYLQDVAEMNVLIVGTCLAVALAHAWAGFVAHRLLGKSRSAKVGVRNDLIAALWLLIPGVVAIATGLIFNLFDPSFDTLSSIVATALIVLLFVIGIDGARRAGKSWLRSLMWGSVDAGVGIAIVLVKLLVN